MSPAAQGNVEIDQYFGNCLITRSPKNNSQYQRQNSRQFHNSQTRNVNNFQCEPFGKSYNNGSRSSKFNPGYPRQTNFVDNINNGWTNVPVVAPTQTNQRRYQQYAVNNQFNPKQRKGQEFSCNVEISRQPFSRMAVNSQNPQVTSNAGKFNNQRNNKLNFNRNNQKLHKNVDKSEVSKQNQSKDSPSRTSDVLSNASDESSGQSENSLPRIIKPRKRRKKDRKPLAESTESQETSTALESITTPKVMKKPQMKILSGTVKQYTPISCEQLQSNNITIQSRGNLNPVTTPPNKVIPKVETSFKDDNVFSPLITDSFVNLILDEDKQNGKNSTVLDKPLDKLVVTKKDEEPSTVCQCRYCDPCGEIWDVEQRCYSPFLTPPSPNEPKLFINSIRSVISGNLTKPSGASYLLRRSWSEPTESSLVTVRSRNKSDSYEPNAHDLQVSSEIITSPNGHRDIEIKFFSTAKRYAELHKPSVPYTHMYLSTPPISPWKKEARFGDLFSQSHDIRSSVNVSL
ncbi:hypothetical protein M8J77_003152 [Diaphorina citri]|nr:hypothetical protein M8J77_003152 [Diaphorina citri]